MTRRKSFLHIPLYPFLIALAPVVSLYALNRLELTVLDMVRPSVVYLLVALGAVAASRLVSKSSQRAAILGCVLIISALLCVPTFRSIHLLLGLENLNGYFLATWLVLTGTIYTLLTVVLQRTRNSLDAITLIFNVFGMVLIVLALVPIVLDEITSHPVEKGLDDGSASDWSLGIQRFSDNSAEGKSNKRPDVYYIILDGYARGDVLQSRFDFNNSNFLGWLERKGFFVGGRSHSNYPWTHLSLSATLDGEYLQTLVSKELDLLPREVELFSTQNSRRRYQFFTAVLGRNFIKTSRVHRFFSGIGYRIFSKDSGYEVTRKNPVSVADAMLGELTEFEQSLINRTIFRPLFLMSRTLRNLRMSKYDTIVRLLESLGTVAKQDGPKFVFYHIMSPHAPFCFNEDGGMMSAHPVYAASPWLSDFRALPGYDDWVMEKYPKNISGLNKHVKKAVNNIMEESQGNAVIIIQSDHGSSSGWDLASTSKSDMVERYGILNAIFIPTDFPRYGLEELMSSVNTFRVVLQNVFDLNLPSLENHVFYSAGDLNFEEVTHRLQDQP